MSSDEIKREPIEIIPYQKCWEKQFQVAKKDLLNLLGSSALDIEHIGSTSVLNLASKNRIDIQIGVDDISEAFCDLFNSKIGEFGFPNAYISNDHLPPNEFDAEEWVKLYVKGITTHWEFKANIHIRKVGAKNYQYALLFRDYLRENPEAAEAYARLKSTLANYTSQDRDAYCEIKDHVCDLIMLNARSWKAHQ